MHRCSFALVAVLSACASGPEPDAPAPRSSPTVESAALAALDELPGGQEVAVLAVVDDPLGMTHVRVQQQHFGVPVRDAQAIVHLHDDGSVRDITSRLHPQVSVDPRPEVDEADARTIAQDSLERDSLTDAPTVQLEVLSLPTRDHLAWRVRLPQMDGTAASDIPLVWVDAHTGAVLRRGTDLRHSTVGATGVSNYQGTVSFDVYDDGSTGYYLEDTPRAFATYSAGNSTSSASLVGDTDTVFDATSQAEAVDAHFAGQEFLDFLDTTFGRDGLDGSGGPAAAASVGGGSGVIALVVDYGAGLNYAGYSAGVVYLGDGDGVSYSPLTTLDIVGHELGHGVTGWTAGFTYLDESGALDEHYADVYGAALERDVEGTGADLWELGEDCATPGVPGDAIRYMDDPTADGVSRDHYDDRYTGTADNGGVHINSGIGNLAFVLATDGGSHPTHGGTALTGLGFDTTLQIWHRALELYLTSGATFADAREATRQAAADLYGTASTEQQVVEDAWDLVGVEGPSGCHTTLPGAYNHCSVACPCDEGEGACDDDTECDAGLSCVADAGTRHGHAWYIDVCEADCHGGTTNGDPSHCSPGCPCEEGEGQCSDDTECASGLSCSENAGAAYGLAWYIDVCEADCHGGTTNGAYNHCSPGCPCEEGEGHCADDTECASGLSCAENVGAAYGLAWYVDVCEADCHGGTTNGAYNHCSSGCPCEEGEGQCSDDTECASGLSCSENAGAAYGLAWYIDVCE